MSCNISKAIPGPPIRKLKPYASATHPVKDTKREPSTSNDELLDTYGVSEFVGIETEQAAVGRFEHRIHEKWNIALA
jgi:hypothetical protein